MGRNIIYNIHENIYTVVVMLATVSLLIYIIIRYYSLRAFLFDKLRENNLFVAPETVMQEFANYRMADRDKNTRYYFGATIVIEYYTIKNITQLGMDAIINHLENAVMAGTTFNLAAPVLQKGYRVTVANNRQEQAIFEVDDSGEVLEIGDKISVTSLYQDAQKHRTLVGFSVVKNTHKK